MIKWNLILSMPYIDPPIYIEYWWFHATQVWKIEFNYMYINLQNKFFGFCFATKKELKTISPASSMLLSGIAARRNYFGQKSINHMYLI